MRSLLHSTFEHEFNLERFNGRNPCSWKKTSSLSKLLGDKLPHVPRAAPEVDDLPHIVAHILDPNRSRIPGYLTTAELMDCTGLSDIALRKRRDAGMLHPVKALDRMWNTASYMYPIEEARGICKFNHEPRPREREDSVLLGDIVLFNLFTGVRPSMATFLRWRNIKDKEWGYIEYLAARGDMPSEHKTGYDGVSVYLVMITDNLRAIIERARQRHLRNGIEIKPDGYVFVHGHTHDGLDRWFGRPVQKNASNLALKRIARALDTVKKKDIVISGIRGSLGAWATEKEFSADTVNLTLGHVIEAVRQNKTNKHYLYDVKMRKQRHELMVAWEQELLKLRAPSPRTAKIVPLRRSTSAHRRTK